MKLTQFGLSEDIVQQITNSISNYKIDKAVIYGSRGRGDFRPESDIDIAIYGENLSDTDFSKLCWDIEGLPIIFKIDIVHVEKLSNVDLINNIKRDGMALST